VAWLWFAEDNEAHTPYWGAVTATITVTTTAVIALMVADRVLARRDGVDVAGRGHLVGLVLAGIAWSTGGLLSLFYLVVKGDEVTGSFTACSFAALNRPDPLVETLGYLLAFSTTPVLVALIVVGRRSRVVAWLSPALILGLYLLATHLWSPHGTQTVCVAM
jgi:hypothetical protein